MSSYPPPPPAYGMPPVPAGQRKLRGATLRKLGWIFGALGLVAFIVGIVLVGVNSLSKVNDFQRVAISNGGGTVALKGTGTWVGYYEASDVSSETVALPALALRITGPDGQDVAFTPYRDLGNGQARKFTYNFDGHHGVAAVQFRAPRSGTYTLAIRPHEALPSDAQIAVGRDVLGGAVVGGALLLVLGVLLIAAAVVLLIIGFVKRSKHKKELAGGYGYPDGYGAPPGYPPAGQYPGYLQEPRGGYPPPSAVAPPVPPAAPPTPGYQPPPPRPATEDSPWDAPPPEQQS